MKKNDISYNAVVSLGRFQPFHKGHLENIKKIYNKYSDLPLIIVNLISDNKKTVFPAKITKDIIEKSIKSELSPKNLIIIQERTFKDAYSKLSEINKSGKIKFPYIWIFGADRLNKDNYLISFLQKEGHKVEGSKVRILNISGTKVREALLNNDYEYFQKVMCSGVNDKNTFKTLKGYVTMKKDIIKELYSIINDLSYEDLKELYEKVLPISIGDEVITKIDTKEVGNDQIEFLKKEIEKTAKVIPTYKQFKINLEDTMKKLKVPPELYNGIYTFLNKVLEDENGELMLEDKKTFFLLVKNFFLNQPITINDLKENNNFNILLKDKIDNVFNSVPNATEKAKELFSDSNNGFIRHLYNLSGAVHSVGRGKGEVFLTLITGGTLVTDSRSEGDVLIEGNTIEIKGSKARLGGRGKSSNRLREIKSYFKGIMDILLENPSANYDILTEEQIDIVNDAYVKIKNKLNEIGYVPENLSLNSKKNFFESLKKIHSSDSKGLSKLYIVICLYEYIGDVNYVLFINNDTLSYKLYGPDKKQSAIDFYMDISEGLIAIDGTSTSFFKGGEITPQLTYKG